MTSNALVTGTVWAVFGHRFALETPESRVLVDLGPKGMEGLHLAPGDVLSVQGERTPCEIRAAHLTFADGTVRSFAPPPGKHDVGAALRIAREAGYEVEGEPITKPKHIEIRAGRGGARFTLHVHGDGSIRRIVPIAA